MAGRRLSSNDVSVVIALAIVVLVLLLTFLAGRGTDPADEPVAAATLTNSPLAGVSLPGPFSGPPGGDSRDAGKADTCGIAASTVGETQSEADAVADRQRDEALQAILAALETRSEPRARAAGLYFRATRDLVDAPRTEACKATPDNCPALAPPRRDDSESAEALARLAVNSVDPQVYSWAYHSCVKVSREVAGSCQLVNALQWARLDPTNAEPWLAVAREARRRDDAAGLDDAMFHVAAAEIHDPGWGRAAAQMIGAAPQADRMVVGTWLVSLSAISYETLDLSSFSDASRYCDTRMLGNANRRDTCEKIATLLVDRSTTLFGRLNGIALAKRLDWPTARLAAAEQERDAAYALDLRDAAQPGEPASCANVRRDLARLVEVARVGEVEALKRRIAATGEPIDVLAAESRQRLARSIREADAARAAASAASSAAAASPYFSAPPPAR